MNVRLFGKIVLPLSLCRIAFAAAPGGKPATVRGYVLDSECAFTKNLDKPINADCARACVKSGSPLVIQDGDGIVYWSIADNTHASDQKEYMMNFTG